ncbi:hypothetical protein HX005_18195, partial [Acinetobacter sp. R933-2]|nr:hypothetical protein [Acinetobacter sp. R933-2]
MNTNPNGTSSIVAPTFNVNGKNYTNIKSALDTLDNGWNVKSDANPAQAVKTGDTVDIGLATGENNLTATQTASNGTTTIDFALKKQLDLGAAGSVTTGATSINNIGINTPQVKIGDVTNNTVLTSTANGLDVGGDKITNVGKGDVSAASTDAINGSQLNAAQGSTSSIIGGGVTNNAGNLSGPFTTNGSSYNTIAEAIADQAKKSKTTVTQGENIVVTSGTNADGSANYQVATAKDVNFDKVTVGNVVTDGATGKISGLTAGDVSASSTDAINGSQLNAAQGSTSSIIGGGVTNNAGNLSGPFTTNGNTYNTIAEAIADQAKKSKTTVTQGENIVVTSGTNADGSANYQVATAKDVKFDKVTVGNVVTDGTTGKISGLTAGDVSANSTDAINGSQLNAAQGSTSSIIGGGVTNNAGNLSGPFTTNGSSYNTIAEAIADQAKKSKTTVTQGENIVVTSGTNADGSANYQVATAKDVNFDKVTVGNVVTDGATGKISGLTAGDVSASSTDAINGSQLNAAQGSTSSIIGGGVTNNAGNLSGPFTTNGSSYNTIAEAIADQAKKSKTTVTQGENIVVTSGTNADGSANYQVATAKDVNFDKVTVGNVVTDGATGKISGLTDGTVAAGSTEAVTGNQLNTTAQSTGDLIGGGVTNTAGSLSGPFNANGSSYNTIADAITDQAKKSKTTVTQGDNIVVTSATNADGSVNYEVATAKDVNFDKVTVGNVVTDGATGKISGLTDGTVAAGSTEAVTGNQLNAQGEGVKNIIGGLTTYDPSTGTLT